MLRLIVFVTVATTAAAGSPFVMIAGEPATEGAPNVHPVGSEGSVGSLTEQLVPVTNGPTVVEAPAARATVCSPAPQSYLIANVPTSPDVFGSNTLLNFKYPMLRLIVFVTVATTAAAGSPFVMIAGEPATEGAPNVHPVGSEGSVGSLTEQLVPVTNGPTVVEAPAARATVCSPAPQSD